MTICRSEPAGLVSRIRGSWIRVLSLAGVWLALTGSELAGQDAGSLAELLRPSFRLSVGSIVHASEWEGTAKVLGTQRERDIEDESLTQYDRVYVPLVVGGHALQVDDVVQIFRLGRAIDDPVTGERLGVLLLPTGAGTVDSLAGETARVRVTLAFLPILVGDHVRRVADRDTTARPLEGSGGAGQGRVVAFQEEKAIHPPFDKLFLRLPRPDTVRPGQVVELYRSGRVRGGTRLPDVVLGKAVIVRTDAETAAAVSYELDRSDLAPGDAWRAVPQETEP